MPDVVTSSTDEPPAGERLRKALARSGASAWLRRHRLLLGGLAGLLVVVTAGTAYVVTRPQAVDPVVRIGVLGFASGGSADIDPQGRPRGARAYQVSALGAGDVDTLVGVVGPGLTKPTSSFSSVKFRVPGLGTLGATVDCSDERRWAAHDADYRARVRRTDTHGRVTTYDASLSPDEGAYWHDTVRHSCLAPFFATLPPAVAATPARHGKRQVDVTLTMTNPSRHALWVSPAPTGNDVVTFPGSPATSAEATEADGPWTALPAGGTASVQVSIIAVDCGHGRPRLPFAPTVNGVARTDLAVPVFVTDIATPAEQGQLAGVWVVVEATSAARLDRGLAELCPGAR